MAMLPWAAKLGGIALPVSHRAIRRTHKTAPELCGSEFGVLICVDQSDTSVINECRTTIGFWFVVLTLAVTRPPPINFASKSAQPAARVHRMVRIYRFWAFQLPVLGM